MINVTSSMAAFMPSLSMLQVKALLVSALISAPVVDASKSRAKGNHSPFERGGERQTKKMKTRREGLEVHVTAMLILQLF